MNIKESGSGLQCTRKREFYVIWIDILLSSMKKDKIRNNLLDILNLFKWIIRSYDVLYIYNYKIQCTYIIYYLPSKYYAWEKQIKYCMIHLIFCFKFPRDFCTIRCRVHELGSFWGSLLLNQLFMQGKLALFIHIILFHPFIIYSASCA